MASDMYSYGMLNTVRKHWLEEREREIVQRWLEATTPSIESTVTQVGLQPHDTFRMVFCKLRCGVMLGRFFLAEVVLSWTTRYCTTVLVHS